MFCLSNIEQSHDNSMANSKKYANQKLLSVLVFLFGVAVFSLWIKHLLRGIALCIMQPKMEFH